MENDTHPVTGDLPVAPEGFSWILLPHPEIRGRPMGLLLRRRGLHFVLRMKRHPVYKFFQYRPGDLCWTPRTLDGTIVLGMLPSLPPNHRWKAFDDETMILVQDRPTMTTCTGQTMISQDTSCCCCFSESAYLCCEGGLLGTQHWACESCAKSTKCSNGQCPFPGCTNEFQQHNFAQT